MKNIYTILALIFTFGSTANAEYELKANSYYTISFSNLPTTSYAAATNRNTTPQISIFVPFNYSANKKMPVILWLDGGDGGAGDHVSHIKDIVGSSDFILLNFPLFKTNYEKLEKDSSNYWTRLRIKNSDSTIISKAYKIMLDSVHSFLPNIDVQNSFMGGFSNGAHTTAVLLNSNPNWLKTNFKNFFFIEGGEGLSDYSILRNLNVMYIQAGNKLETNWVKDFYLKAKKKGANASFIAMKTKKHEFPVSSYYLLRDWIVQHSF